ncbi:MAG: type II toxin-antitoxin system HicA family toxin [Patescibacteria group bacterium]
MTKLPVVTHKEIIKVAQKLGFVKDHQKGSHLVLRNPETKRRVVIPIHAGRTKSKREPLKEFFGIWKSQPPTLSRSLKNSLRVKVRN